MYFSVFGVAAAIALWHLIMKIHKHSWKIEEPFVNPYVIDVDARDKSRRQNQYNEEQLIRLYKEMNRR